MAASNRADYRRKLRRDRSATVTRQTSTRVLRSEQKSPSPRAPDQVTASAAPTGGSSTPAVASKASSVTARPNVTSPTVVNDICKPKGISKEVDRPKSSVIPNLTAPPPPKPTAIAANSKKDVPPNKVPANVTRLSKAWPSRVGKPKIKGLPNPGQWCYRRSLLQTLVSLPQFFNLLDGSHKQCGSVCVTCSLRQLIESYHGPAGDVYKAVSSLDRAVTVTGRKSDPSWKKVGQSQEDAHDFLQYLLGTVEKTPGISKNDFRQTFCVGHQATWTCVKCKKGHIHSDPPSYSLQLSISAPPGQPVSIASCLDRDQKDENLIIRCDGCKKNLPRTRLNKIQNPPDALYIQLKRFGYNLRGGATKNSKRVRIDDDLDLSRWCVQQQAPAKYRLQAIVAHSGSLTRGHYVAYVRGPTGIKEISDSSVRSVSEHEWKNPGGFDPYILLYLKQ